MLGMKRYEFRIVKIEISEIRTPICEEKIQLCQFGKKIHCVEHSKHQKIRSVQEFENFRRFENQQFFGVIYGQ